MLGITVSAISRISHIYPPMAPLYTLDFAGTLLLLLCLLLLFRTREDYPEIQARYFIISSILLIVSLLLLYGGFALQKFVLDTMITLGVASSSSTFWGAAIMIITALILLPVARFLPLHGLMDQHRRNALISALITSMIASIFLAILIIDAISNLTYSLDILASRTPYDTNGAIANIQATIFAEDVFLIFLIVGDTPFALVYLLAHRYGLGGNLGVIDDVFFIYRDGRLIYHGTRRMDPAEVDPDILASMLTAVSDFVKDSFSSRLSGSLESMKIGDYNVLLVGGKYTTLAVTSLGVPLRPLREYISATLRQIEKRYEHQLRDWNGVHTELKECITEIKQKFRSTG